VVLVPFHQCTFDQWWYGYADRKVVSEPPQNVRHPETNELPKYVIWYKRTRDGNDQFVSTMAMIDEVARWSIETDISLYKFGQLVFLFYDESDATIFKLRWC
jgi:hypothetical protein